MTSIALVTGAAGGIGRATVEAFARNWKVIAVDRRDFNHLPDGAIGRNTDVAEEADVKGLFRWIETEYGRLDALVNNAAVQLNRPIIETSQEDWDEVLNANLRSVYLTSRFAHPLLEASIGSIVNVASVHALATSINIGAYAASKGGVLALTRATALEFAPVRVNAILPGAIDTPMLRSGLERAQIEGGTLDGKLAALADRTALGRIGKPSEIANAILFLADGEQSSFITGAALVSDGGALARLSTE